MRQRLLCEGVSFELSLKLRLIKVRSTSLHETSTRNGSRSSVGRSQTTARKVKRTSTPLPAVAEESKKSPSKGVQRSTSVFGSIFGPPRPTVPEAKSVQIRIYILPAKIADSYIASNVLLALTMSLSHELQNSPAATTCATAAFGASSHCLSTIRRICPRSAATKTASHSDLCRSSSI